LYERAVGYTFESEKVILDRHKNEDGTTYTDVRRISVRQHVPPDVGACDTWLRNKRPDEWHDKRVIEFGGTVRLAATDLANLGDADLDELQRQYSETLELVAEVQPVEQAEDDRA
jgi:hypothetical protein